MNDPLDLNFLTGDALGELEGEEVGDALADALDEELADADAVTDGEGLVPVTTIVALSALVFFASETESNETFLVIVAVIPIFLS